MNYSERLEKILNPLPGEFVTVGLLYVGSHEDIQADGSKYKDFLFFNKHSEIKLRISVSEENGSISVFISHPIKGGFSLRQYLIYHKRKQEYDTLYFPANTERYIDLLRRLVSTEWHEIIVGNQWEDIPFDWTGYK